MDNGGTVLGGWGVAPEVLAPVFGSSSVYINSNELLPSIIDNGKLSRNWNETLASAIGPLMHASGILAGWSTGAIIAYGCASRLPLRGLVLFAGTPSFCRTPDFRHGMRTSIVASMKQRLKREPASVIQDFQKLCGLAASTIASNIQTLSYGLDALMQLSLFDAVPPACPVVCFHGEDDAIIPIAAGEALCSLCNGVFVLLKGSHACFTNNTDTIQSILTTFFEGMLHESV